MPNLEAKFRLSDYAEVRRRAETIGFVFCGKLVQRDTFFNVTEGKLKLRDEPDGASLIHYHRDHVEKLELSNYRIVPVAHAGPTREILGEALGVLAEVRKERLLLMRRNIRLHLDHVEALGEFGELEAVMGENEAAEAYRAEVTEILIHLKIQETDLIRVSYYELARRA
jgi:adenylate cyclase class 2